MSRSQKILATSISILTLIGLVGTGFYVAEERYDQRAQVAQVQKQTDKVEQRLDYKITQDHYYGMDTRLEALKARYGQRCERADPEVQRACGDLERDRDRLRRELEALEKNRTPKP